MAQITYKYKYDSNYNPKYANGAYGGISPLGEIIVHFYLERTPLPNTQTVQIGNHPNPEFTPEDLSSSLVRFIDTGVILNYNAARELHRWLGEQIKVLESIEEAPNKS